MSEIINVAEIFGENVFNDSVMQERLPKKVYKELKRTIQEGKELEQSIADVVAHEMKEWAIEKGATHYSHSVGFSLLPGQLRKNMIPLFQRQSQMGRC